jgi:hypothetical protein
MLERLTQHRGLPLLDNVRIAAPCKADGDAMAGDDRVRFCAQCEKNVYNLSAMPRQEAEALLLEKEGKLCVRLCRRADGTVLTSDCPVGVRRRRRRRRIAAMAIGGGLAAAAASATPAPRTTMGAPEPAVMGEVPVLREMGDAAPVRTMGMVIRPSHTTPPPGGRDGYVME